MVKPKAAKSPLQRQLEQQRFLHAVAYVHQAAPSLKKLTTSELMHLNQILTGSSDDPWRVGEARVELPTGDVHEFNIISNSTLIARDILGDAVVMAGNQKVMEAAANVYSRLVLEHLFNDANRRTAVLATVWLLGAHSHDIDAEELLAVSIGNLRQTSDLQALVDKIKSLSRRN
ncbi:MAG: hypothetical protein COT73_06180 [Bdellovibrio sp. CG10_big_fil_rev_8_21_14_0_10_47_8]|nr:MAG: hypothetical protein COT73_06180 [Bdellovibrio sp. CG10_big_fil_rev_8_21_14_0_10_47_8]